MSKVVACADRVAGKVVVDAFCGVGGNAVHFAQRCRHVIGVDNCLPRLQLAQQNAWVYGVAGRLDLLCADYFDLRDQLKACPLLICLIAEHRGKKHRAWAQRELRSVRCSTILAWHAVVAAARVAGAVYGCSLLRCMGY